MKRIVLLLLMTLTLFGANAKDAAFMLEYREVYKVALDEAKKEHKVLMMVIVKEPCPYCDKLVENTLDTQSIKAKLKNFVPLIISYDDSYPDEFRPPFRPMTLFINPDDSSVLKRLAGYRDVEVFKDAMNTAEKKYQK
jgi:thioredoxin-related protein